MRQRSALRSRGRRRRLRSAWMPTCTFIERMVRTVQPDVLHLCGTPGEVGPEAVAELRRALPGVAIMQAIAVTGPEAVDVARSYEPVVDYLILDSVDAEIPGVGAAGIVHDWEVSAAIVAAVDVPVILAGGLSPENVEDAIAAVRPWGVDSLTFTNRPTDDGGFRKDLERVGAVRGRSPKRGGLVSVLVVGDTNVDLEIRLPSDVHRETHANPDPQMFGGGSAANTAAALARLERGVPLRRRGRRRQLRPVRRREPGRSRRRHRARDRRTGRADRHRDCGGAAGRRSTHLRVAAIRRSTRQPCSRAMPSMR